MTREKISKLGRKIKIKKIRTSSEVEEMQDIIPAELLLAIFLNGKRVSVISCSPSNLIDLTVGYLINNAYIEKYSDINLLKICNPEINKIINRDDFFINMEVNAELCLRGHEVADKADSIPGNGPDESYGPGTVPCGPGGPVFISSACGSMDELILSRELKEIKSKVRIKYNDILRLNRENAGRQQYKKEFGGLHSAALFDNKVNPVVIVEDIGRHNCIDKIAGRIAIMKINADDKVLYTTGRLSLDAIYKIVRMNIPVLVTNSSITYSAALLARKMRLTAIGYARGGRFNVYSCPQRIIF